MKKNTFKKIYVQEARDAVTASAIDNYSDSSYSKPIIPIIKTEIPSDSEVAEMKASFIKIPDEDGTGFRLLVNPIVCDRDLTLKKGQNVSDDAELSHDKKEELEPVNREHNMSTNVSGNMTTSYVTPSSLPIDAKENQNQKIDFGLNSRPDMVRNSAIIDKDDYVAKQKMHLSLKEAIALSQSNGEETELTDENSNDFLNPYQCMQKLIQMVPVKIVDDGLYVFTGVIYELLTSNKISQLIVKLLRYDVTKAGNTHFVSDVRRWIYIEPNLVFTPPNSSSFVAFKNKILDLKTNTTLEPTSNVFLTSYVNLEYDEGASEDTPVFCNFLSRICGNNTELIARIWEMVGYLLTPDMNGKAFFVLQGVSNSGKSVLGRFIMSFFDSNSISSLDLFSLGDKFALYNIVGKRINASLDLPSGKLNAQAVSNLKQLTGGDTLTAEAKYENAFRFENTCKFIFATNHTLKTSEPDEAFNDRCVVIPFQYSIPKQEQDFTLLEKFDREKMGIVKKALRAYLNLKKNNYIFSGEQYARNCSNKELVLVDDVTVVRMFFDTECEFTSNDVGVFTFELFERYQDFCKSKNLPAVSNIVNFSEIFKQLGGNRITHTKWRDKLKAEGPQNGYKGITLKN